MDYNNFKKLYNYFIRLEQKIIYFHHFKFVIQGHIIFLQHIMIVFQ